MNRFADIDLSAKKLPPIYGYHVAELIPIELALQPIESQINELPNFIKIAKQHCHYPSEHGLSHDQSAAVYIYTMEWGNTSLYRVLNQALRSENRQELKIWFPYLKLFDTALDKLPTVQGAVWRGVPLDIGKNFTANQRVTWWNISSCSSSVDVIKSFMGNNNNATLFLIEAVNGKRISGYTQYETEDEVILRMGIQLQVRGNALEGFNGSHIVHLMEVDDNPYKSLGLPMKTTNQFTQLSNTNSSESTSTASEVTETINCDMHPDIIQNVEFQEFIKKLESSQRIIVQLDEIQKVITIRGKKAPVNTAQKQIQDRIIKIARVPTKQNRQPPQYSQANSHNSSTIDPTSLHTIDLSVAKNNFLELFGGKILDKIRKTKGINSVNREYGKLQLAGDTDAVETVKSDLQQVLGEENIEISIGMKKHLESTNHGRILREFLQKYRVGSSLQNVISRDKNKRHRTRYQPIQNDAIDRNERGKYTYSRGGRSYGRVMENRGGRGSNNMIRGQRGNGSTTRGQGGRNTGNRGQRARGNFTVNSFSSNIVSDLMGLKLNTTNTYDNQHIVPDLMGLKLNTANTYYNQHIVDNDEEAESILDLDEQASDNKANDENDNNSELSDSDSSLSSSLTKDFEENDKKSITITLCSDSQDSLSKAVDELRNYAFCIKQWMLTQDQTTFILSQQLANKPQQSNNPIRDKSIHIRLYLAQIVQDHSVHISIIYLRCMWYVKLCGTQQRVESAMSKIKNYLDDVVETEVQIPISKAMAYFLRQKASTDLNHFERKHNVKITIFPPLPPRNQHPGIGNDQNNDPNCLKIIGSLSRVNLAQEDLGNFLRSLSEREENFLCENWDTARKASERIVQYFKKLGQSKDSELIGWVRFYDSLIEKRETTPRVTFTIVSSDEDTMNDIIQQCRDITEGYAVWKLTVDEYRAIDYVLIVKKSPSIEVFQQNWEAELTLDKNTNTIIISAQSKKLIDEIKEELQSLSRGKQAPDKKISVTIPMPHKIRGLVYQEIRSILDQGRSQGVSINSNNPDELRLHGFIKIVTPMKEKISMILSDIEKKIIKYHFTLLSVESELIRANSYAISKRIQRETNTIIRHIKIDKARLPSNTTNDENINLTTTVSNDRSQTIVVKIGGITKIQDVDAIVNAANEQLDHTNGIAKVISDAAGPVLNQECRKLIVQNGDVAIPIGTAIKTTAGNLPFRSIIHAIGLQYAEGNKQERRLLFSCVLSTLRLAEKEGYTSIALPAVSSIIYGFPLQHCTTVIIRAVKQFFADFPQSHIRKVILLNTEDSTYKSFACEVLNDHTNTIDDENFKPYELPSSTTAEWYWDLDGKDKIYADDKIRQIENAFQQYLQLSIQSNLIIIVNNAMYGETDRYSIQFFSSLKQVITDNPAALNGDLVCGYQTNENTGTRRLITRRSLREEENGPSAVYRPKPLDMYYMPPVITKDDWEITGLTNQAIHEAEMEIQKDIKSATITKDLFVNLNEDIEKHKNAIRRIATQQQIQVDFSQHFDKRLRLTLKGLEPNVLEAERKIALCDEDI